MRKFEEIKSAEIARRRRANIARNVILAVGVAMLIALSLCHRIVF